MLHEINYKKLGFVCGIEIHQQLDGRKLFGNTPTIIRDDNPDYIVSRKIRAVLGETGVIDSAALEEMKKNKTYEYQGYTDTIDLVELDEEPPTPISEEALQTALQTAILLHSTIVDEVQVMRKTIADGSNTSGFQRTALVARNGSIKTSTNKVITIPTIIIEEDSCKRVAEENGTVIYNLSRLGIPLIEIGTGPDMNHPDEVVEVAEKLGLVLRSTGKVKRGIGTIRQDVNVSIAGGARVEIKGAQDLKLIPTLIDYEILRQMHILDFAEEYKKRGGSANSFHAQKQVDISHLFASTQCQLIAKAIKQEKKVIAIKIPHLKGLIGRELQPNKRLGTDLSDYAKVHAGTGGIIHSDEDFKKYLISEKEIAVMRSALHMEQSDAFIIIVDTQDKCDTAMENIKKRLSMLLNGVPKEVRRANPDATTTYMRPMPGEARMYPETDVPPKIVNIEGIYIPELIEDKITRYVKEYQLGSDLAKAIAKGSLNDLFESMSAKYKSIKPSFIAETIESTPKMIKRKHDITVEVSADDYDKLFSAIDTERIAMSAVSDVLIATAEEKISIEQAIGKFELLSDEKLRNIIKQVQSQNAGISFGALIGKVMAQAQGRADGRRVTELIKEISLAK